MKPLHLFTRVIAVMLVALPVAWAPFTFAADGNAPLPLIIQSGLDSWTKGGGPDGAMYVWQKGGLFENSRRSGEMSSRLRQLNQALGSYLNYEVLRADSIGKSSEVLYLAMNFQRGAVFARFVLYRADKSWVVQDLDLGTRPEAIMPWMSFAGERSGDY